MKRIFLFLATNLAVMVLLTLVLNVTGLNRALNEAGFNVALVIMASAVIGFGGAFISLLMSKFIAKISVGARVIDKPQTRDELWLVETVRRLAEKKGVGMPEVAIYDGAPNAFATGAFRNSALVAVSTGLLGSMDKEEIEAVLGHELSHVANGDMVTLTLLQGVVNTFVIFLARVVGFLVDKLVFRDERETGIGYYAVVFVCEILFGFIASMIVAWYSRRREYRADAGSAQVLGSGVPMIHALQRLQGMEAGALPKSMAAFGIDGGLVGLFASHPPLEDRIRALQKPAT